MESKTTLRLPVIDFSKQELEWESVKGQVRQALEEYGAFEAFFDKTPDLKLRNSIFQAFEESFNLPLETKKLNVYKNLRSLGYVAPSPLIPFHESLAINEANNIEKVEHGFTNILWPEGKPSFSKTIQSFAEQLVKIDETVRRMILESFRLDKYMDEHLDSTTYVLRGFKYNIPETPEMKMVLPPHKDKNIMTILCQMNQVDGLEVQTKDGDWINAKFSSPDSFIVMIGESLQGWLNGRLSAPNHRVILTGNKERYSIGGFSSSKSDYLIKVPEELVDEEHPLLYKPFEFYKYLEYIRPEGRSWRVATLKDYCGVE